MTQEQSSLNHDNHNNTRNSQSHSSIIVRTGLYLSHETNQHFVVGARGTIAVLE